MTTASDAPAALKNLTSKGTVTSVPVQTMCSVRYAFDTASKPNIGLRYAVAVNERVQDAYADKPRALSPNKRHIDLLVPPGSTVTLYLNSDSHPAHRNHPVYPVEVGTSDVVVRIKERMGKEVVDPCNLGSPRQGPPLAPGRKASELYETWLTGDVWKLVSHRYTPAQVQSMLGDINDQVVQEAVENIYAVLPTAEMLVTFPASKTLPKHKLKVVFDPNQDNVFSNTTGSLLTRDVLTRVHPMAYCALLTEARAAGVTKIHVTSTWRPLLGSIGHRAGLGLDINYVEWNENGVRLNREDLRKHNGRGKENVSERERELYAEAQAITNEVAALSDERRRKRSALLRASDASEKTRLTGEIAVLDHRINEALERRMENETKWEKELNKNQPPELKDFRERLARNRAITEVFDPWYMDENTKDAIPFRLNKQFSSNEQLHSHHLHLTVLEPKLL